MGDALDNHYISPEESADCLRIAKRANVATSRLRQYLLNKSDGDRT